MQATYIKILSIFVTIVEVAIYVLLAVSMYTVVSSFMGSLSPEGGKEPLHVEFSPLGDVVFSLKAKNSGMLDSTMRLNVKIISKDRVVAEGEQSRALAPHAQSDLILRLKLPMEQMAELQQDSRALFFFESRTLNGLTGMGVRAEVGGIR